MSKKVLTDSLRQGVQLANRVFPKTAQILCNTIKQLPEIFVHEYTHYYDLEIAGKPIPRGYDEDEDGDDVYYNTPLERNAYFQQGMSRVDRLPGDQYHISFPQFLKNTTRQFNPEFIQYLTEPNKRRFISRLYMAWNRKHQTMNND